MGTILNIAIDDPNAADRDCSLAERVVNELFDLASHLEKTFSRFDEGSDLSRLNRATIGEQVLVTPEFISALNLAIEIQHFSSRAFQISAQPNLIIQNSYVLKSSNAEVDLTGLSKGYIVDQLALRAKMLAPDCRILINAGGDLKILGAKKLETNIRIGQQMRGLYKTLSFSRAALATSAYYMHEEPDSRTTYIGQLRAGFLAASTVVVNSDSCAMADALTKVALFASNEVVHRCAEKFNSEILVFSEDATLEESFGAA